MGMIVHPVFAPNVLHKGRSIFFDYRAVFPDEQMNVFKNPLIDIVYN